MNESSKEDLAQIPGVDDRMAEAIIEFREWRSWTHNLEELADVGPVEAKDMGQLREWLTTAYEHSGSLEHAGQREELDVV